MYRELDRDSGLSRFNLAAGETRLWDARFRVSVSDRYTQSVEVGPIGDDWARLVAEFPNLVNRQITARVARGIPAFRTQNGELAVPALVGWLREQNHKEEAAGLAGPTAIDREGREVLAFAALPVFGSVDGSNQIVQLKKGS